MEPAKLEATAETNPKATPTEAGTNESKPCAGEIRWVEFGVGPSAILVTVGYGVNPL